MVYRSCECGRGAPCTVDGDPQLERVGVMIQSVARFISNERGMESMEYAVMLSLVVGAIVIALVALAAAMSGRFGDTQATVEGIE